MSAKKIWYGVLEAGEKTSPVVRNTSIDASENKVYLYNYVRDQFIEYSQPIVEPKLRKLAAGDISQNVLEKAYRKAYRVFSSSRKVPWSENKPATSPVKDKGVEDEMDIDLSVYDDAEEFIDDE